MGVSLKWWQQYVGSVQIAGLPAGEMKANRVAQSIYGGVNLGAQSAFAAPDGLIRAPFFQRPGAVLVGAHDGRVDPRLFVVRILSQMLEQLLPHASFGPTAEPRMHHPEIAEPFRQVTPRNPSSIAI